MGLKDLVARPGAWRPSSAEPIRLPALLEPFQARGLEGCESLLLEGGGPLLLWQLEGLVPQELLLLLGGEDHLRGGAADASGLFCCQGGIRGASSSSVLS